MNGTSAARVNGVSQLNGIHDGFFFLVGTFRSPEIYTLNFKPPTPSSPSFSTTTTTSPASLTVSHTSKALGGHSWLALSGDHTRLYATTWADPPSVCAYAVDPTTHTPTPLNTAPVASLSGYVTPTPSGRHLISVGGPSGEVFRLEADGRIGALAQVLSFRRPAELRDGARDGVAHGSFGGLRWGAHSVDVAPGGRAVYVADIGHNCVWSYALDEEGAGGGEQPVVLRPGTKHVSPRPNDGPRHCWPHPGGQVLYVVQEHSGMVDAFRVDGDGVTLQHARGESIMPEGCRAEDFWADEVRTSNLSPDRRPRWLYASTRGLKPETKGYLAVYELDAEGTIKGPARDIYQTRTSGGLANAIEPAPRALYERLGLGEDSEEFIALTDSEQGWVTMLGWDGRALREVAATKLGGEGNIVQAATAIWL